MRCAARASKGACARSFSASDSNAVSSAHVRSTVAPRRAYVGCGPPHAGHFATARPASASACSAFRFAFGALAGGARTAEHQVQTHRSTLIVVSRNATWYIGAARRRCPGWPGHECTEWRHVEHRMRESLVPSLRLLRPLSTGMPSVYRFGDVISCTELRTTSARPRSPNSTPVSSSVTTAAIGDEEERSTKPKSKGKNNS